MQTTRRTWRRYVWVVKQEKGQEETNPYAPSRHCSGLGSMCGRIHLSYDDSSTARLGQGDAWTMPGASCRIQEGEMGTGARGAPVPEVGLYVKIRRAQSGSLGSRPNQGHVNFP